MHAEGPSLASLLHRLSECPADFLAEPRSGKHGTIEVLAIVCDHFRAMGLEPSEFVAQARFAAGADSATTNRLRLIAVATWLLNDPWLRGNSELGPAMGRLLSQDLDGLAGVVQAESVVTDPDRREELVRLCLKHLGLRPQGETELQAADRLLALDSIERDRVVRETRRAEARAREVRQMMARRAAEEAAAKASRE